MELNQVRILIGITILTGLAILCVITLLKPDLGKVGRAFLALVVSLFAWYFLHTLSFYLSRFWSSPSYTVGSLAGVAVILVGTTLYSFCEYFPEGTEDKNTRKRILFMAFVAICLAPLTFSKLWISNRGAGATVGPFFYMTSGWVVFAAIGGVVLQIRKFQKTKDPRKRNRILRLLTAILVHVTITVFFSVVLPAFGSWNYFFLGPASAVSGLALVIYAIQFHPLLNLRAAVFQIGLRLVLGLFVCTAIYLFLTYIVSFRDSARFTWELAAIFSLFFLAGLVYGSSIHRRLENRFFPRGISMEELIVNVFLRQTTGAYISLEGLLREMLEPVVQRFELTRIFAAIANHEDGLVFYEVGDNPNELKEIASRLVFSRLGRERRLPKELVEEGDRLFLLDEDASIPFRKKTNFTRKYARLVQRTLDFRTRVVQLGCRVVMPLVLQNEVCGYLLLGDKLSGRPYFENEIDLLEKLRNPFAALVRNHIYYERIQFLKNRAEAELRDLKSIGSSNREIIHQTIGNRILVYRSSLMEETLNHAKRIAPLSRPVFINGETGTGKELIALLIHEQSRASENFVPINCAALPPSLWEDEIFGHVKGAFTDAKTNRSGAVERAGKGSLFFDEIGEMPLSMQAKMLRLLQERQFAPIGGRESVRAECRFIFATNRNLEEAIRRGEFREDLYYRINVFRIELVPLRDRQEDIEPLIKYMLAAFSAEMNSPVAFIAPQAMRAFLDYSWPGNIRELENILLRALSTAKGPGLSLEDVPEIAKETTKVRSTQSSAWEKELSPSGGGSFHEIMDACALRVIRSALDRSGGNKTQAAKLLGIRRSSLEYRLKERKS
ncbi:sigma 54-interacting transcriptional regulator [Leptospira ilyithenensis]|uniref:AAA family ATPase n=1 Tax=Leptospira ilyithenensis TaxID=2484901 RepID=A0A4R9LSZ5_9LEPT|nr:sigma 54-interacting transcriptional regulator [Leptospira ilyithenensis]TGN11856.1 AAA family ATPase [Leptospira ilyithenensis]